MKMGIIKFWLGVGWYYPLGYDLFTFMFQSSFYYHLKKSSFTILKQNNDLIKFYFDSFKIWEMPIEFAS
jgi:hypothetical protein